MRTVDEYMKLPYKMEIIPDTEEGGYAVSFPDLPGCLTVGDTIEEAIKNATINSLVLFDENLMEPNEKREKYFDLKDVPKYNELDKELHKNIPYKPCETL